MSTHLKHLKNKHSELQLFNRRGIVLTIFIAILTFLLFSRLVWLQVFEHHLYKTLSNQNQLNLIPIEPTRGLIYDRNNVLLAENQPEFSLDVIPAKAKDMQKTINEINQIIPISDDNIKQFQKFYSQKRKFDPIPLKPNLTEDEIAKFSINQWRFPGVVVNAHLLRHYPLSAEDVAAIGFMGRINQKELSEVDPINYSATNYIGKLGIEKFYENILHGNIGYQQVETDASGRIVRTIKRVNPVPGDTLYISLDSNLQKVAEDAMGDQPGALVAIDPSNGQILAFVSNPSYDPNLFVAGISDTDFKALQDAPNRPLYNRAIRGLFASGSTIKPYYAVEGLESGVITPNYTIHDLGFFKLGNHTYHDMEREGHGNVNLQRAITVSCDVFFFNLANMMGIDRLDDILHKFGFGKLTGIDIGEELPGLVPSPQWKEKKFHQPWYGGDTVVAGIGQGYLLVTPLQLAQAVATLSEHGKHFQPHLLVKIQHADGSIETVAPVELPPVNIPDNVWNVVVAGMQGVVKDQEGTGFRFGRDVTYPVAAKTGTAQVFSAHGDTDKNQNLLPENLRDNSWFTAFAPVNNPKIAVAVIVEHSQLAASVARKVMDYYLLQEKNLPVDDNSQKP